MQSCHGGMFCMLWWGWEESGGLVGKIFFPYLSVSLLMSYVSPQGYCVCVNSSVSQERTEEGPFEKEGQNPGRHRCHQNSPLLLPVSPLSCCYCETPLALALFLPTHDMPHYWLHRAGPWWCFPSRLNFVGVVQTGPGEVHAVCHCWAFGNSRIVPPAVIHEG